MYACVLIANGGKRRNPVCQFNAAQPGPCPFTACPFTALWLFEAVNFHHHNHSLIYLCPVNTFTPPGMAPPTNEELNAKREEHCIAITHERKYYRVGQTWIKRTLRPSEWQKHNGYMPIPLFNLERVLK